MDEPLHRLVYERALALRVNEESRARWREARS
jgi:hypothetical protein